MKKIILIDLDNTACDYTKAHKEHIEEEPGIIYPQCKYKFFEDLDPIKDFIFAYFELKKHYRVFIVSSPSIMNKLSYTEKAVWIEKHLGSSELKYLILAYDKTLVKGDYLIDDFDQDGVLVPEWEQIKFGTKKFPDWKTVLNYLTVGNY